MSQTLITDKNLAPTGTMPAWDGSALMNLPSSSASGNVAFPSTQIASADANTLDDYEEGTWTPGFQTGSPSYNTTYARNGYYTKIGRKVFIGCTIYMGSITWGDANALIELGPLPFTASNGPDYGFIGTAETFNFNGWSSGTYNNGGLGAKFICSEIESNASVIKIRTCDETSSRYYLRNAALGNGDGCIRVTTMYNSA